MPDPKPAVDRRDVLGLAGTVAGALLLQEAVHAQNNPAEQVGSRLTACKITGLKAFRVGTKAFVKIETNQKIDGWGEITGLEPTVACTLAEALFELLDGENPTRVEYLWQKIYRSHRDMRGGPFMVHTLSAIDNALWDITGKFWGVPVYHLLGGAVRERIRVYHTPKAHKTGTGGPHPWSGGQKDVQELVKRVEQSRKQVGPDGAVMFDAHCAVPPPMLIQFAAAIQPYDVLFIEEPAVPGNIEVFKRLKEAIRVPLATGERDRTIWGMLPYLQERCIDVLQPDCAHTGGITQVKKIATLAEAYLVPLAPHCTCSFLGVAASFHAAATVPFLLIHEFYENMIPAGVVKKSWEVDKAGYASLPQGPGLGVEIDETAFAKVNEDPRYKYKWPKPTYEDGSVRDY